MRVNYMFHILFCVYVSNEVSTIQDLLGLLVGTIQKQTDIANVSLGHSTHILLDQEIT